MTSLAENYRIWNCENKSLTVVEPNRSDESSEFLDIALKKIDSQFPFSNLNKKSLFAELYSR